MPSIGARAATGESIYAKIRRKYAAARFNNRFVNGVMASPPTVTDSLTQPGTGLTNIFYFTPSGGTQAPVGTFRFRGGTPVWNNFANHGLFFPETHAGPSLTTCLAVSTIVEFMTDSPTFWLRNDTGGGGLKIIADGQYHSALKIVHSGSNIYWLIDFTSVGGRKMRRIGIDVEGGILGIHSIGFSPVDTLLAVSNSDILSGGLAGDSFSTGAGSAFQGDAFCKVLGAALDADIQSCGVGGTGYVNNGGGTQPTAAQHISDLLNPSWTSFSHYQYQPYEIFQPNEFYCLNHGYNDVGGPDPTGALSIPQMQNCVAQIRAVSASAPIFVFGLQAQWFAKPLTTGIIYETALLNAVTALGDANTIPVPMLTDPVGAALWGTGNSGAPTGNGNSDIYRDGTNGVHPTSAGHTELGFAEADRLVKAIAGKA